MKLWNLVGRGQSITSLNFIHSRALPSFYYVQTTLDYLAYVPLPRHVSEDPALQLSLLQLFCPSFLLHKITEAAKWERRIVIAVLACRPSQPAQLQRAPSSPHPCPFTQSDSLLLLSGSSDILSVAIGAIGKQRLKINYPVSSSSLMNK